MSKVTRERFAFIEIGLYLATRSYPASSNRMTFARTQDYNVY